MRFEYSPASAPYPVQKAEDFLRRAQQLNRFAGGPFDFVSGEGPAVTQHPPANFARHACPICSAVCPPYELVDYNEIFDLLDGSPLVHEVRIISMAKQAACTMPSIADVPAAAPFGCRSRL